MDAMALLKKAKKEKDPKEQYALLLEAEMLDESHPDIQRALLYLGNGYLYAPGDLRRIRCYPFHSFEHPEYYSETDQQALVHSLLHHPRMGKCLAFSPDPAAFQREFFTSLALDYITIFIREDRSHLPFLFSHLSQRKLPKWLAHPMSDVIRNIFLCPFLSLEEQSMLAGCFYRACYQYLAGAVDPLNICLGAEICALIQ